jgi:hypothetical protein
LLLLLINGIFLDLLNSHRIYKVRIMCVTWLSVNKFFN